MLFSKKALLLFAWLSYALFLTTQAQVELNGLWTPSTGKRCRISSCDTTGQNRDYVTIPLGTVKQLCNLKNNSGVIQRIWFTLMTSDTLYLQKVKIKMTFDDEITVDKVPLGMLTGTGPWRVNDLVTPVLNVMRSRQLNKDQAGAGSGSFNIHFPMPFTKNVKIEVQNNTSGNIDFFYYIDYTELPFHDKPLLFHASYNIQSPTIVFGVTDALKTSEDP